VSSTPAGTPNYLAEADSYAQYTDSLAITGGTGSGVLQLQYTVDGSGSGTGYTYLGIFNAPGICHQIDNGAVTRGSLAYLTQTGSNISNTLTFYVPFTDGSSLSIEPIMRTSAQYVWYNPAPSRWDHYNTASLTSALTLDGTADNPGNPVGNAMIAATSGRCRAVCCFSGRDSVRCSF
jgi:hypothetical protein